jgi:hypothetical protein
VRIESRLVGDVLYTTVASWFSSTNYLHTYKEVCVGDVLYTTVAS